MTTAVFDSKRDKELIAKGTHFWCESCLVARLLSKQSPDPRYCKSCYIFLKAEASLLTATRRPGWIPKKQCPISGGVDNTTPPVKSHSSASQGHSRKKRLPRKRILEMFTAGLSPQIIAGRLKAEYRIEVSNKDIRHYLKEQGK